MACSFCSKDGHNARTCPTQTAVKNKKLKELQTLSKNKPASQPAIKKFVDFYANNPQELTNFFNSIARMIEAVKA